MKEVEAIRLQKRLLADVRREHPGAKVWPLPIVPPADSERNANGWRCAVAYEDALGRPREVEFTIVE